MYVLAPTDYFYARQAIHALLTAARTITADLQQPRAIHARCNTRACITRVACEMQHPACSSHTYVACGVTARQAGQSKQRRKEEGRPAGAFVAIGRGVSYM